MGVISFIRNRARTGNEAGITETLATSYDPDANLTSAQGGSAYFRRLTSTDRSLDPIVQDRMIEIALWLYKYNPKAKRVLELTRDFVLGDGVVVRSQDENIQRVIDAFWSDPINNLDVKLFDRVLDLGLYGEQLWPVSVVDVGGLVRLGYIEPALIHRVIPQLGNPEEAFAVITKVPGLVNTYNYWRVIHVDEDPNSPSFGRLVGAAEGETLRMVDQNNRPTGEYRAYTGSAFFFPINKVSAQARGVSDLFSLADWIDAYDQMLFGDLERSILMRNYIWDVTLQGMDKKQIMNYAKENPRPKPGAVRYHNEKVTWNAVSPDLNTHETGTLADLINSEIATGAGFPKTWLNAVGETNRAAALELTEPAIKRLNSRQRIIRYIINRIVTFALDQAELAGNLSRETIEGSAGRPKPWEFTIGLPNVRNRDINTIANTLFYVARALQMAHQDFAIDRLAFQKVMLMVVNLMGVDINEVEMEKRIEEERAEAERKAQEFVSQQMQMRGGSLNNGLGNNGPRSEPAVGRGGQELGATRGGVGDR